MIMKALPQRSGEYLLEIIMRRHENRSTMMTSNRPLEDWAKLSGGDVAGYADSGAEWGSLVGGLGAAPWRAAGGAIQWAAAHSRELLWAGAGVAGAYTFLGDGVQEAEAVTPAMRAAVAALGRSARTMSQASRSALAAELRAMRAAGAHSSEMWGLRYGVRRMWVHKRYNFLGGLHYSGNQGLDAVFSKTLGSRKVYAILEAKAGSGLSRLATYSGLRQGSAPYNLDRINNFLRANPTDALARQLRTHARTDQLRSFASFLRGNRLYQLPQRWDSLPALLR